MKRRLTNETRDGIILQRLGFERDLGEIAKKYDVSEKSVELVVFVYELVKGERYDELKSRTISSNLGLDLCRWAFDSLGKTPPPGFFEDVEAVRESLKAKRKEATSESNQKGAETASEEAPPKKANIPAVTAEAGWQTRIKARPDRVSMTVYFNGVPVVEGFAKVKGDKELDLMQGISYAAHMCYKIVEQKKLSGR